MILPSLFLGLLLGLGIGRFALPSCPIFAVIAFLCFFFAKQRKTIPFYLGALALGVLLAQLGRLPSSFPGEGIFLVTYRGNGYAFLSDGLHRFYLRDSNGALEVGDILRFNGKSVPYSVTHYEGRSDFGDYLASHWINNELKGSYGFVTRMPIRFGQMERRFLSSFSGETKSLLGKLCFGYGDSSSASLSLAEEMDVLFALSVSGFFLGAMLRGMEAILRLFMKDRHAEAVTLGLSVLLLPLGLRKIGVGRVLLMRALTFFSKRTEKPWPRIGILSLSGLIQLSIDPTSAYQSGFLLGYGLSFVFLLLGPSLNRYKKMKRRALGYLALRLFLLPLSMISGNLHLFSPLNSLLLLPFGFLTMVVGYVSFLTFPFTHLLSFLASAEIGLLTFLGRFDISLWLPGLETGAVIAFYLLYFVGVYFTDMRHIPARRCLVLSSVGIYAVSCLPLFHPFTYSLIFLDVGQGDCIILRQGNTTVMMDTGGVISFDIAKEVVIPYLLKQRIYRLDALIASHGDYDHIGGVSSLVKEFHVKSYLDKASQFPVTIGSLSFTNYNTFGGSDENDKSLVLKTTIGPYGVLLTGDASTSVEKQIVSAHPELRCDILKAGHHGSKTSTCSEFLDLVTPKVAIISCGENNKYGHPDDEVVGRLMSRGIEIRRTDREGTVVYSGAL